MSLSACSLAPCSQILYTQSKVTCEKLHAQLIGRVKSSKTHVSRVKTQPRKHPSRLTPSVQGEGKHPTSKPTCVIKAQHQTATNSSTATCTVAVPSVVQAISELPSIMSSSVPSSVSLSTELSSKHHISSQVPAKDLSATQSTNLMAGGTSLFHPLLCRGRTSGEELELDLVPDEI